MKDVQVAYIGVVVFFIISKSTSHKFLKVSSRSELQWVRSRSDRAYEEVFLLNQQEKIKDFK